MADSPFGNCCPLRDLKRCTNNRLTWIDLSFKRIHNGNQWTLQSRPTGYDERERRTFLSIRQIIFAPTENPAHLSTVESDLFQGPSGYRRKEVTACNVDFLFHGVGCDVQSINHNGICWYNHTIGISRRQSVFKITDPPILSWRYFHGLRVPGMVLG